jgi:hypothetical protein
MADNDNLPPGGTTPTNNPNPPSVDAGTATGGSTGGAADYAMNVLDPGNVRKQVSGLGDGGWKSWLTGKAPDVKINTPKTVKANAQDWRVKIQLPPSSGLSYGSDNPLLNILSNSDGLVFPYTPSVSVTHTARYQEQALTHSNYKNYFYEGSHVEAITIAGDFTVQNHAEALYVLAAIYFLRSCTKMFWGNETHAGNPPPIVYLDGYGDYYFPHVSCVVTSFQHTMPADVDYMEVAYSQGQNTSTLGTSVAGTSTRQVARIPVNSQLSVTLQPVYSRKNIKNNMSLSAFSQGKLLKGKGGFL